MKLSDRDKIKLRSYRDLLFANAPLLTVYLGQMETATSTTKTSVTVANTVRGVGSVWLSVDNDRGGPNYYSDPKSLNFTGKTITLDTELPAVNTSVAVAYYSDCAQCGWDEFKKQGRDSNCSTCQGKGKILALGDPIYIPVKRSRPGTLAERLGIAGEEASGNIVFTTKAEYEIIIRAAIQMIFESQKISIMEDASGAARIRRLYNAAGECMAVRLVTEYEPRQEG